MTSCHWRSVHARKAPNKNYDSSPVGTTDLKWHDYQYSLCLDYTCTYKYVQCIIQNAKLRWGKAWLYGLGRISITYLVPTYTFFLLLSDCIHTVASSDTLARRPELRAKVKDITIHDTWSLATPQHIKALWYNTVISIHKHTLHLHNNSLHTVQQECMRMGRLIPILMPILMRCWCNYSSPTQI